jgi:hypothetical protein
MSLAALSLALEPVADTFHRDGYVVLREVVDDEAVGHLLARLQWLAERVTAQGWSSVHSVSLARHLGASPDQHREILEQAQVPAWLPNFVFQDRVHRAVFDVLGQDILAMRHVDLRLDLPLDPNGIDVWHQDVFYTRGSKRAVCALLPLQDMGLREGALHVMPGSHRIGPVAHDNLVLGQRHFPSGIEDREIRMIPLRRGDLVLLDACMLYSLPINLSPAVRGLVQARFLPHPSSMGGGEVIPLRSAGPTKRG